MHIDSNVKNRLGLFLTLIVLGLVTALAIIPTQFGSQAVTKDGSGLFPRTVSHEEGLDFYDIRMSESGEARESLIQLRELAGKDASFVADERERFVQGSETSTSEDLRH